MRSGYYQKGAFPISSPLHCVFENIHLFYLKVRNTERERERLRDLASAGSPPSQMAEMARVGLI